MLFLGEGFNYFEIADSISVLVLCLTALKIIWGLYKEEKASKESIQSSHRVEIKDLNDEYSKQKQEIADKVNKEKEDAINAIISRYERQVENLQINNSDLSEKYQNLAETFRKEMQKVMQQSITAREQSGKELEKLAQHMSSVLKEVVKEVHDDEDS